MKTVKRKKRCGETYGSAKFRHVCLRVRGHRGLCACGLLHCVSKWKP